MFDLIIVKGLIVVGSCIALMSVKLGTPGAPHLHYDSMFCKGNDIDA